MLLGLLDSVVGGCGGGGTPGPIPNPEAKLSSADGTAPARVWESRTPPDIPAGKATPPGVAFPAFHSPSEHMWAEPAFLVRHAEAVAGLTASLRPGSSCLHSGL